MENINGDEAEEGAMIQVYWLLVKCKSKVDRHNKAE